MPLLTAIDVSTQGYKYLDDDYNFSSIFHIPLEKCNCRFTFQTGSLAIGKIPLIDPERFYPMCVIIKWQIQERQ